MDNDSWQYIFSPQSVAVIGASNSPGSWGACIAERLLASSKRSVYLVNPNVSEVLGRVSYDSVTAVPYPIDLATIVVPTSKVHSTLQECIQKRVKAAVIITAGFAETSEEGRQLEAQLVKTAREGGIRFIGPNSMGHADTTSQLSTLAWMPEVRPGPVALISQSGNYGLRIISTAMNMGVGFSKFISTGNEANLHFEDYLEYLIRDDKTKIIAAYVEGLREARRFFHLARQASTKKPIVLIKAGGTKESAKAASSHTGALSGSETIYSAAFRQAGVIRADDDDELCDVLAALVYQPLPHNNRVAILTSGGGMGVVAAEICEREGLQIATLSPSTIDKLDAHLPSRWSHANPVDMAGLSLLSLAEGQVVFPCLWALMEDENVDAVLLQAQVATTTRLSTILNSEQMMAIQDTQSKNINLLKRRIGQKDKPVFMVTPVVENNGTPARPSILDREGIVAYHSPRRAARVLHHLVWYRRYLDSRSRE